MGGLRGRGFLLLRLMVRFTTCGRRRRLPLNSTARVASMRNWRVFNVDMLEIPRAGHEVADSVSLNRALGRLQGNTLPDTGKLSECRARVERKMTGELRQADEPVPRANRKRPGSPWRESTHAMAGWRVRAAWRWRSRSRHQVSRSDRSCAPELLNRAISSGGPGAELGR
jgi:hypothetical protein